MVRAEIRVDGGQRLSADAVGALAAVCDAAEDQDGQGVIVVRTSGAPPADWADDLSTAQVSKWERAVRRLESLPAVTIAVADGDCGGMALDVMLAADYRIAAASTRLVMPRTAGGTWPGMALYRIARQATAAGPARKAVLFGAPIGSAAALSLGLIDEVAVNATVALEQASKMAAGADGAELAIRRQLMLEALTVSFEDALGVHLAACDRALRRSAASTV